MHFEVHPRTLNSTSRYYCTNASTTLIIYTCQNIKSSSFDLAQHVPNVYTTKTRRIAQRGNMARKSNGRESDPSTADASAHEDVEMQDQEDKMNGFKKFGVSQNQRGYLR